MHSLPALVRPAPPDVSRSELGWCLLALLAGLGGWFKGLIPGAHSPRTSHQPSLRHETTRFYEQDQSAQSVHVEAAGRARQLESHSTYVVAAIVPCAFAQLFPPSL